VGINKTIIIYPNTRHHYVQYTASATSVLAMMARHAVMLYSIPTALRRGYMYNKKHLNNVGPIRHNKPPHANSPGVATVLSHAARASMSTTPTTTTTTTTTRDRGDRYGPMEWAQLLHATRYSNCRLFQHVGKPRHYPIHVASYILANSPGLSGTVLNDKVCRSYLTEECEMQAGVLLCLP